MIHAVWAFVGRVIYYVLGFVALPILLNGSRRVKVGIIDPSSGRILLAKSWIGPQQWNLVGGGIKRIEDKFVAATREIKEETGLDIDADKLTYIGQIEESEYMSKFTSHVFITEVSEQPVHRQPIEILELGWFDLTELPRPINMQTINALEIKSAKQG